MTRQSKELLDQMRDAMRLPCFRRRVQAPSLQPQENPPLLGQALHLYDDKRQPLEMGEKEIGEFLTYLAVEENVAVSTQNPLY